MLLHHLYGFRKRTARPREPRRDERAFALHARVSSTRGGPPVLPPYALPALILMAVGLLGAGLFYGARAAGRMLGLENPAFTLGKIVLPDNLPLLPRELVIEKAGIQEGDNLFARDVKQIRADLLAVPAVRTVEVTRRLPDRIDISLTVREPAARAGLEGGFSYLVDLEGMVFGRSSQHRHLPLLRGVDPATLQFGQSLLNEATRPAFEALRMIESRGWQDILPVRMITVGHPDYLDLDLSRPAGTKIQVLRNAVERGLLNAATAIQRNKELGVTATRYTANANGTLIGAP
jgi:hypothetical protein